MRQRIEVEGDYVEVLVERDAVSLRWTWRGYSRTSFQCAEVGWCAAQVSRVVAGNGVPVQKRESERVGSREETP